MDVLRKLEDFWLALVTAKAGSREKVSCSNWVPKQGSVDRMATAVQALSDQIISVKFAHHVWG